MRLSTAFVVLSAVFAGCAGGAVLRRATVSPGGVIRSPTAGITIASGETFSVDYGHTNRCNAGYSPVDFYLLSNDPATGDVTSSGTFSDPIFHFGKYLVPNFGLPPMTNPPPPPSIFTMPDLAVEDSEVYFAVIETFLTCPPEGHIEYGLSTAAVDYDA